MEATSAALLDDGFAGFCPPQRWPSKKTGGCAAPILAAPLLSHRFSLSRKPPPPRARACPPLLPSDVCCTILSLCAPKDAAHAAQCCRAWRDAFCCPGAWVNLDFSSEGPIAKVHDDSKALAGFLSFLMADGGQRLSCLEQLVVDHSGGTEAQLVASDVKPGTMSWEMVAPVVVAASASLRTVILRGPPPGSFMFWATDRCPLVHTGVACATFTFTAIQVYLILSRVAD